MANRPLTFFSPDSCLSSVTDLYELTITAAYFETASRASPRLNF